jgi:hypothetical protein
MYPVSPPAERTQSSSHCYQAVEVLLLLLLLRLLRLLLLLALAVV